MKRISFFLAIFLFSPYTVIAEENIQSWGGDEVSEVNSQECHYPEKPEILKQGRVTEEILVAEQHKVNAYIEKGNAFLDCLAALEQSWLEPPTAEQQRVVNAVHNLVVDEMESVAAEFNAELKKFKGE